jgi:hypothetical protein
MQQATGIKTMVHAMIAVTTSLMPIANMERLNLLSFVIAVIWIEAGSNMNYRVSLDIKETASGVGTETHLSLEVSQAPSGLYIATCPPEPFMSSGETPRHAILGYLGDLFWRMTVEAEQIN